MPETSQAAGQAEDRPDADPLPERFADHDIALVLSGGNALGAYQAGAYQALADRQLEPGWVAGASVGSVNGAIICGNPLDQRVAALEALWMPHAGGTTGMGDALDEARRTAVAAWTFATGKPDIFVPRNLFGPWWNPMANPEPASLYDTTPLRGTLERLIDFDRLNAGEPRYCATAVDIETGADVIFDTRRQRIGPEHIRASSALLPAFPPVEIDGQLLGDAGISANLPLDGVLSETLPRPLLCIAIDLLPLRGPRPRTLGETVIRMQDLMFATQSRRAIAAWQAIFDERAKRGQASSVTLLHIAYSDHGREVSGKAFDFSPQSTAARWQAGHADLGLALDALATGEVEVGQPGLSVYALTQGSRSLDRVQWELAPIHACAAPASV